MLEKYFQGKCVARARIRNQTHYSKQYTFENGLLIAHTSYVRPLGFFTSFLLQFQQKYFDSVFDSEFSNRNFLTKFVSLNSKFKNVSENAC